MNESVCDGCLYLSVTERCIVEGSHTLILQGKDSPITSFSDANDTSVKYNPVFGITTKPGGLHIIYGDAAQNNDNFGIVIDIARSSFRVICDTIRIGHEYIEDYGDSLKQHLRIRNMTSLTASLNVSPSSQLFLEDNGCYLREIPSLETMTELSAISDIAFAYLENRPLPSWFLHEAYQRTKHWVGEERMTLISRLLLDMSSFVHVFQAS